MKRQISEEQERKEKEIALSFFRLIAPPEGPMAAVKIFDPKARHHNPYSKPGMKSLLKEMAVAQESMGKEEHMPLDAIFEIKDVIVDGNMVVVRTNLRSRSNKKSGFRQIHLFRFRGDKIAEYWDVTQTVPKEAKYPSNMF